LNQWFTVFNHSICQRKLLIYIGFIYFNQHRQIVKSLDKNPCVGGSIPPQATIQTLTGKGKPAIQLVAGFFFGSPCSHQYKVLYRFPVAGAVLTLPAVLPREGARAPVFILHGLVAVSGQVNG
jgi:hypothetical protein